MKATKRRRRLLAVLSSGGYGLLPNVLQILFSYVVINASGLALWGQFVEVLIVMNLLLHFLNWGARDYLLTRFAAAPANMLQVWRQSIRSRLPMLGLAVLLLSVLPVFAGQSAYLAIWLLAAFFVQSVEAFVVYRKDFLAATAIHFLAILLLLVATVFRGQPPTFAFIIAVYGLHHLLKALLLAIRLIDFRRLVTRTAAQIAEPFYRKAFPFFILGFTGMLQSKTDLYCLAVLGDQAQLGHYQILINALAYLQISGYLLLQPFAKALLRMPISGVRRVQLKMAYAGIVIIALLLPVILISLQYFYQLQITWGLAIAAGMTTLPMFFYTPLIYHLYGKQLQKVVVWVTIVGIAVNLLQNLLLIPKFQLTGAMIAAAASQWTMLLFFAALIRRVELQNG